MAAALSVMGFSSLACRSSGRDEVYVAAVALRASKGAAQLLMSTAYSFNVQHFMVIIKPSHSSLEALVCDFQPKDPENIWVAVSALSGRQVPGVILVRKLGKLPKRKCWFVGYSNENAFDAAIEFNKNWETDLRIGLHDCRTYCEGLVEHLTGEKTVLERLG